MSTFGRALIAGVVIAASAIGPAAVTTAQAPIRVGASLAQTGRYAIPAQNQLRGYRLCVKHTNEQGGVFGRTLELVVEDDQSQPAVAARIYEKLITQNRVDAIIGPYASAIVEAVADVAERHQMAMVASSGSAPSIYKKGRRFIFQVVSPSGAYLEGLLDLAARQGLETVAIIHENSIFPTAVARGAVELARKNGLKLLFVEAYPRGTTDFTRVLTRVRAAQPDVLAAGTYFEDAVAITHQLKALDINPKMYGVTVGGNLPKFYAQLGKTAEFVYGASQWEPDLVNLRAGGLVPIARQYPGAQEFVEAYRREFSGAGLSYHSAAGYGGCQVFMEALRRAGSLDSEQIRDAILMMDLNTVYGAFRVDSGGSQIAHRMVTFQWQDGKKVIVWPTTLAPDTPRFPTPPWSQRP